MKKILITGGRGFIGFNFINSLIKKKNIEIISVDKINYSSIKISRKIKNNNLKELKLDIREKSSIENLIDNFQPNLIINFAAESHVDRSIEQPKKFITNNILGTFNLLNASLKKIKNINKFLYIQISTDEVYGNIEKGSANENSIFNPSSPYAASKASADHLVKSYFYTYSLPIIISHCSNNYGPFQFPEKLIPLIIHKALNGKQFPLYGNGKQKRDWIHVDDHISAIDKIISKGKIGEIYNIGSAKNISNYYVVSKIYSEIKKGNNKSLIPFKDFITYVKDRPGHDVRYALDTKKIYKQLKWKPNITFDIGISKTVKWYVNNYKWMNQTLKNRYNTNRLGLNIK